MIEIEQMNHRLTNFTMKSSQENYLEMKWIIVHDHNCKKMNDLAYNWLWVIVNESSMNYHNNNNKKRRNFIYFDEVPNN